MKDWSSWVEGFRAGYSQAKLDLADIGAPLEGGYSLSAIQAIEPKRPKRKVKQTKKQKLLTQMTKKKWDKYKKGKGKKTYVEIRAEVSRSQAYKKACKRL